MMPKGMPSTWSIAVGRGSQPFLVRQIFFFNGRLVSPATLDLSTSKWSPFAIEDLGQAQVRLAVDAKFRPFAIQSQRIASDKTKGGDAPCNSFVYIFTKTYL